MRRGRRSGFTMVEVMVTLAVSLVLFGLVFRAAQGLIQLSSTSLAAGQLEETAGRVSTAIASELRWVNPDTFLITTENGSTRVDCEIAEGHDGTATIWSTPVTFRYEPSLLDDNENGVLDEGSIVRVQDGHTRTLCRRVPEGGMVVDVGDGTISVSVTAFAEDRQGRVLRATTEAAAHAFNRSSL